MDRIQSQDRSKVDCANQILSWVIFARRPITIEELRCALAVEPEDSNLDEAALLDRGYLLSVCGGLIMISGDTETVRFIHYTAQEYFERAHHHQFSSAQEYLATTCITYLSFSTFASGPLPGLQKRLENALLDYASVHWGNHVRECRNQDPAIRTTVTRFLTRKSNVCCSIQSSRRWVSSSLSDLGVPTDVSDLHVAASFGLEWLVEERLQQGASVDSRDSYGQTPLHQASANGHINITKRLLESGANPISRDRDGFDAIRLAVSAGHESVTRFLLYQRASLPNMRLLTIEAAKRGHLGILRVILEPLKGTSFTALFAAEAIKYALGTGSEASVRLLLEEAKDLEMKDMQDFLSEALCEALEYNHFVVVQLLLEYGADLKKATTTSWSGCVETPLHRVIRDIWGWTAAKYLIDHGADIEAVDSEGDRPIHIPLYQGGMGAAERLKLLLDRGADVNVYDANNETPLIAASRQGRIKSLRHLLDRGADTLAKDKKFNRSAIEWAVLRGHPRVVQLLSASQQSIEVSGGLLALTQLYQSMKPTNHNDEGSDGEEDANDLEPNLTADNKQLLSKISTLEQESLQILLLLHRPASIGDEIIVRAFIDMGADIEALSHKGDTALHRAAQYGHASVVELLLDHGAMIDQRRMSRNGRGEWNYWGRTPLASAISRGFDNYDTVHLLIERGADIERDSDDSGTPLMRAVFYGHEAIVRLLLESGANPNTEAAYDLEAAYDVMGAYHFRSKDRGNALHLAVSDRTKISIIRLLITKGANLEAKNRDDDTPLLLAVRRARPDVVSLLLELGATPTTVEETTVPENGVYEVDFDTAMQLVREA